MTDQPTESPQPRPPASAPTPPPAAEPSPLELAEPPPARPNVQPSSWVEPPARAPLGTGFGPPPPHTGPYPGYARAEPLRPQQERTWAAVAHLSALGAFVIGLNFIGPLITYLVLRDRGEFVRDQAAESLNFQITAIVAGFVSLLCIPLLGLGLLMLLGVFLGWLVLTVIAGVRASNGELFRYPVNLRLVH